MAAACQAGEEGILRQQGGQCVQRQVGKTTMLKHLAAEQKRNYVSMDNTVARTLVKSDPVLFFQTYKPPIIIDEIQKAPELFGQIKVM